VNTIVIPMLEDSERGAVQREVIEAQGTTTTNSTGNITVRESIGRGIFGDPGEQLTAMLLSLGIVAGLAVASAVAGFLTSGSSTEAAKVGGIVGFLATIGVFMINLLLALEPILDEIPVLGDFLFVLGSLTTVIVLTYAAAGLISGGGAY
jgi:hypothetical protein